MMEKTISISIIIPIYNVAQYLEKCIGSAFNQGLKEDEFEVIIVDDGSPDDSLLIAQNVTRNKQNVTIVSQENKGLGGARNTGISLAKGEYLLFLDADDWLLSNVLPNILSIANKNELEILEFAAQGISLEGKVKYHIVNQSNAIMDGFDYYNSIRSMNSACNKLYKNDFLTSNNLFFLEQIFIEDFEFNTRVFCKAKKVFATDFLVAQFLQSSNSITRNLNAQKKQKMVSDTIVILKKTKNLYADYGPSCDTKIHTFFRERLGTIVVILFIQLLKNKTQFSEIKKIRDQLIEQNLFYIDFPVFQKNKEIFRKIALKNFWSFRILQSIIKII